MIYIRHYQIGKYSRQGYEYSPIKNEIIMSIQPKSLHENEQQLKNNGCLY